MEPAFFSNPELNSTNIYYSFFYAELNIILCKRFCKNCLDISSQSFLNFIFSLISASSLKTNI
ncbi:MAG: hypothetical protein A3G38_04195 [Omnitrophica WOR_2 bacterium RIFCSPLOWO2_12_FULL_51_8]|nr:MAG: hypothetical protein A3G38_04195 [Omnitrophica WOR_2 bacterium RIFCSPLOWO2_12_FULL_51_8]